jgi:hypothetical protein
MNFAQAGTSKMEMGIIGTAGARYGSLYINRNIQVGETGASIVVYKSNGFVGINNLDPSFQLDVNGEGRFSSTIRSDAATGLGIGSISGYRRIQYDNSLTTFGFLTDANGLANIEAGSAIFSSTVTATNFISNVTNSYGLIMNRPATTNFIGLLYETATVNQWFVGLRENGTNNYIIYNEVTTSDAFTINQTNNQITLQSSNSSYGQLRLVGSSSESSIGYRFPTDGDAATWTVGKGAGTGTTDFGFFYGATVMRLTTSGTATLIGSTSDRLIMTRTSVGTYHLSISATNRFSIYDPAVDAERISIFSNGNVFIGPSVSDAGFRLDVNGTGRFSDNLRISKSSNSGSGSGFPRFTVQNTLATQGDGSSTFNFADINISSGNEAVNMFLATTFAAGTWAPAGIINVSTNHELQFKTNNTTRLTLSNSGVATFSNKVGIGTVTPVAFGDDDPILTMRGTSSGSFQYLTTAYNATQPVNATVAHFIGRASSNKNSGYIGYQWRADSSDQNFLSLGHYLNDHIFRIYASGRGVFNATAASLLDYAGPVQSFMINGGTGDGALTLNSNASGYAYINFAQGLTSKFEIGIVGTSGNGSFYINRNIQAGETGSSVYINKSNGFVGILANNPQFTLDVGGDIRSGRLRNIGSLVLNSYQTINPSSNVYLYSTPNDRDSWIFLDSADTGSNWGIYHRQIDSAVLGLPGNSIGFIGGGTSTLQAYINIADGSGYFRSSVTASSFFESSDKRMKTLLENTLDYAAIANVTAKYYEKNGKTELGYFAQDFETLLPSAVTKNEDGMLNLSYREVHTAKIAMLEKEIKELKEQLKNN